MSAGAERVDVLAVLDDLVADMGTTAGTTGDEVAQARDAVRELIESADAARECLRRGLYLDWQECTCEECPECGEFPNDCSGTECAQTCQCSLCDHCYATGALEALDRDLARVEPQP